MIRAALLASVVLSLSAACSQTGGGASGGASARAARTSGQWITDTRNNCQVWNPEPQPDERIEWSGACSGGKAQGQGVLVWFLKGKPIERYEGEMRDGRRNGRGTYELGNREKYDGGWRDDMRNGRAVVTWPDGSRYEGEFQRNQRNGRGVYAMGNGDRYDGGWRDDRADGQGTYTAKDGRTFAGQWTRGCYKRDGQIMWLGTTQTDCELRR